MIHTILLALLLQGGPRNLQIDENKQVDGPVIIAAGTTIPIALVSRISTKDAKAGDGVYAKTLFPVSAGNQIIIPEGSYVKGKIVDAERPGKVKGKALLTISFQMLTLPSGVTMPLYASLGSVGGSGTRRGETSVEGDATKGEDGKVIAETAGKGAVLGGIGARSGKGAIIGGGIGAAAGLAGVLFSRGQDLVLDPGTTLEIILDRPLEP